MSDIVDWFLRIPPVTRFYMGGAVLTTVLCWANVLSPFSLFFSTKKVLKGEVWRLLSSFFFFSQEPDLDFLFHMYFLLSYSRGLEEASFRGRSADYLFMLLFGGALIVLAASYLSLTFLSPCLTFMMVYVWSRRNEWQQILLFGVVQLRAPWLPWVMVLFSLSLGGSIAADLVGIAVGHLYYYLQDVYPNMTPSRRRLLKTPAVLRRLFREQQQAPHVAEMADELHRRLNADQ
ncbi:MAG: hypothetical protein MHM6MM_008041 [Cercozoa sp. M6MM]